MAVCPSMNAAFALLPDFALILLGAALRPGLHLGDHFWNGVEKLVYFVLFPALLFNGLVRTHINWTAAGPQGRCWLGLSWVMACACFKSHRVDFLRCTNALSASIPILVWRLPVAFTVLKASQLWPSWSVSWCHPPT